MPASTLELSFRASDAQMEAYGSPKEAMRRRQTRPVIVHNGAGASPSLSITLFDFHTHPGCKTYPWRNIFGFEGPGGEFAQDAFAEDELLDLAFFAGLVAERYAQANPLESGPAFIAGLNKTLRDLFCHFGFIKPGLRDEVAKRELFMMRAVLPYGSVTRAGFQDGQMTVTSVGNVYLGWGNQLRAGVQHNINNAMRNAALRAAYVLQQRGVDAAWAALAAREAVQVGFTPQRVQDQNNPDYGHLVLDGTEDHPPFDELEPYNPYKSRRFCYFTHPIANLAGTVTFLTDGIDFGGMVELGAQPATLHLEEATLLKLNLTDGAFTTPDGPGDLEITERPAIAPPELVAG